MLQRPCINMMSQDLGFTIRGNIQEARTGEHRGGSQEFRKQGIGPPIAVDEPTSHSALGHVFLGLIHHAVADHKRRPSDSTLQESAVQLDVGPGDIPSPF